MRAATSAPLFTVTLRCAQSAPRRATAPVRAASFEARAASGHLRMAKLMVGCLP